MAPTKSMAEALGQAATQAPQPMHSAASRACSAVARRNRDGISVWGAAPVEGVLEHGATFRDDEYLGDGESLFHFNQPGFQALCQRLGCRQDFLVRLETPTLPSEVLNDLLSQRDVRETLRDREFVMDERTDTIIGLAPPRFPTLC